MEQALISIIAAFCLNSPKTLAKEEKIACIEDMTNCIVNYGATKEAEKQCKKEYYFYGTTRNTNFL